MRYYYLKILFFIFITSSIHGQINKTIYFDQEWKETTKNKATYYRNLPLETKDDLMLIKDFYISGQLQMKGWAKINDEDSYQGEVTWFYENGNKQSLSNYKNGELDGIRQEFYENGTLKLTFNYEEDYKEGEAKFFTKDGALRTTIIYEDDDPYKGTTDCFHTYKEGEIVGIKLFFEHNNQLAYEKHIDKNQQITENYYKKNGEKFKEIKTNPKLKKQDSFKFSYYPGSNCGYVISKRSFQQLKKEKLEGDEYYYNLDGSIRYHGVNKDNNPYEGAFLREINGLTYIMTYAKGIKKEEEIIYNDKTIAKGTYLDKKKHQGTFIARKKIQDSYCTKIYSLNNGIEEGKQLFKRLKNDEILYFYEAHNGEKEGESYLYDEKDNVTYTLFYKKGNPDNGALLDEDRNVLIYKQGKLEYKKIRTELEEIEYFEIYQGDKKTGVEYSLFEINGQKKQEGTYKNDQPHQGYFLRFVSDIPILDYYENGIKKHQYSKGMHGEKPFSAEQYEIPFKSTYKNDNIYTGVDYEKTNFNTITIKILNKKHLTAISIWKFSLNYGNNIFFKKTKDGIQITENQNPYLKIKIDQKSTALIYKEEIIDQRKKNANPKTYNKIVFYMDNNVIKSLPFWGYSKNGTKKINEYINNELHNDFLTDIYAKLSPKSSIESVFEKFETLYKDIQGIATIEYNSKGKPSDGVLIEQEKKLFTIKLYKKSKLKESISKLTLPEIKEQIQIWNEKYEL